MKFQTTSPENFKTIPWKNGKGNTIEVAINEGGTLDKFDWRLSMAYVVEDGEFSNFSGYLRNLVLIKGHAITLHHDNQKSDVLESYLDFATFNGGNKTTGHLPNGAITDFNIITNIEKYNVNVLTSTAQSQLTLSNAELTFIYNLANTDSEINVGEQHVALPPKHLFLLEENFTNQQIKVKGQELILIQLTTKASA